MRVRTAACAILGNAWSEHPDCLEKHVFGLTTLGFIHTVISLVAMAAGIVCLLRDREISPRNRAGMTYLVMTVLTCLTGFGIFQHGGFGKPHLLGIITLVVLALAGIAGRRACGRASAYVATISYSLSFLFHVIPGVTETTTRLPLGAPLFTSPDDPALQAIIGACFVVFLLGVFAQVRRLLADAPLPMGVTAA